MFDKLNPYMPLIKIAAILLLLAGVFFKGYGSGKEHVQDEWDKAKAAQLAADNQALLKRNSENAALQAKHDQEVADLKKGHQDEIVKINAARDSALSQRLRITVPGCHASGAAGPTKAQGANGGGSAAAGAGALPEAPDGNLQAALTDQGAMQVDLPEGIDRGLKDLMLEADKVVASCRVAQKFITDNGMSP